MTALASLVAGIPDRKAVIAAHKQSGGRVAAVYPIHYPRALLRAHGLLPVEVWGPPRQPTTTADARVQAYVCTIVRCGLSFLLDGGVSACDLVLLPHACDSLQGMASLLLDSQAPKPIQPMYIPRGGGPSARAFLRAELAQLRERLEAMTGLSPDDGALMAAVLREEEADGLLGELLVALPLLHLGQRDLYRVLRAREYLPAEDFIGLARAVLRHREETARPGVPLLLSGIVPEPMGALDTIAEAGATVVADDFAAVGRRVYPPGDDPDPLRRLASSLLGGPPCTSRGDAVGDRVDHLLGLADRAGAKGVIFLEIKFCEPELFYLPLQREALNAAGLPSVVVEVDLCEGLSHQAVTRIEALVETAT